jgi:hypothetical protein
MDGCIICKDKWTDALYLCITWMDVLQECTHGWIHYMYAYIDGFIICIHARTDVLYVCMHGRMRYVYIYRHTWLIHYTYAWANGRIHYMCIQLNMS